MTCNYNNNLPHFQILSRPNSKIGNFSSSNTITTDYAKSKYKKKILTMSQNQSHYKSTAPGDAAPLVLADRARKD